MKKKIILVTAALFAAVMFYGCDKEWGNDNDHGPGKTTADFTYAVSKNTVTFTNTSSHAEDFSWNFGDSGTSTSESPQHSYATSGDYVVTLKVSGHCGRHNSVSKTVTIHPIN